MALESHKKSGVVLFSTDDRTRKHLYHSCVDKTQAHVQGLAILEQPVCDIDRAAIRVRRLQRVDGFGLPCVLPSPLFEELPVTPGFCRQDYVFPPKDPATRLKHLLPQETLPLDLPGVGQPPGRAAEFVPETTSDASSGCLPAVRAGRSPTSGQVRSRRRSRSRPERREEQRSASSFWSLLSDLAIGINRGNIMAI